MGLLRFLIYSAIAAFLWFLIRRYIARVKHQIATQKTPPQATVKQQGLMLRCRYCQLHLPEAEIRQKTAENEFTPIIQQNKCVHCGKQIEHN
ncbi:hypothetical protein [Beggiatoa leptomitoformis]|uniref:Uncharacterized protein n=1 Tax=Beggiatoa leptomitoformis TaxID=288004 RepID=A0A2N9YGD1_9GAMM|nr:hypothetical protein [Beggiatoa leptomitoformis]ALG68149.1 hypothetical protein AL038_11060 [Beggiatoa leptomitoformis]AUI69554.1 hypothetical protein BLE401_13200 [Beggiatoa leptomitoformis]